MVIVDTTVWIDYLRGAENSETRWLDGHLEPQRLGLPDLILCEVLQGIRDHGEFRRVRADLLRFHVFQTGGSELAVAAAQNCRDLRQQGYTVRKTIDCLIATFCLQPKHELLHRDHDFDCFEKLVGLKVVASVMSAQRLKRELSSSAARAKSRYSHLSNSGRHADSATPPKIGSWEITFQRQSR
jgi:predicted nucleic acid-binding protein